jgi:predicted dehydrogenase
MAYRHASGYERLNDCELVACADIARENAEAFATTFDIDHVFEDYERMLEAIEPDVVSVCVPPAIHAELVIGCAESGVVDAIHCEKPMAETWGKCKEMATVCESHGVQLTINHQMRFGAPYRKAKTLLDRGRIGELQRIEFAEEHLYDSGTHLFDLCNYYAGEAAVEWMLAQVEYQEENIWFGTHNENQALAQWKYDDGVFGLASTGYGTKFIGCYLRLVGSEGTIEIGAPGSSVLRVRRNGSSWDFPDTGHDDIYGPEPGLLRAALRKLADRTSERIETAVAIPSYTERAIADTIRALRENREPELSASRALRTTELIFASWESARRRGRVDLPLSIEDNPLAAMVESGQLQPDPKE